jgi:hypothetical protein
VWAFVAVLDVGDEDGLPAERDCLAAAGMVLEGEAAGRDDRAAAVVELVGELGLGQAARLLAAR